MRGKNLNKNIKKYVQSLYLYHAGVPFKIIRLGGNWNQSELV